jgi:hypothetical protein
LAAERAPTERLARWLPALIPLVLAALMAWHPRLIEGVISDPHRRAVIGIVALVVGLVSATLIAAGVDVRDGIRRGVHAVTSALRYVVSMLLYLVILLPLGAAHLWRRADPLRTGTSAGGSAWHPVTPSPARLAARTYRNERPAATAPRRPLTTATRVIGAVVLLLAADFAIGAVWDHIDPDEQRNAPTTTAARPITLTGVGLDAEPIALDGPDAEVFPPDPREDLPAMAKYPWRHEYFQELQRAQTTYWPYVMWRPLPATGRYVNITGTWERRGYTTPGATTDDVPDVDFYGGSTIYGEGQRDQHTIASEVTRLAEADGVPIRAHNRGVRGWVNWQEMLLFEQLSADPATRPELALFYDGANEFSAQSGTIRGVPAHSSVDQTARRLAGEKALAPQLTTTERDVGAWGHLQLLARDYRDTSATARVGAWLHDAVTGSPAGAEGAGTAHPTAAAGDPPVDEYGQDSLVAQPIYQRGQAMIEDTARRRDVDVLFFWQPLQQPTWDLYATGLRPPTIDLSQVFAGHDDIFIDGTHHNEDGSVIAAEAIWEHLKPQVQAWYDDH